MSRILFAWELGGNLGHFSRQLPIALQLRQRGHDVFFVARDTAVAAQLLDPHDIPYTQAPFDTVGKRLHRPPISYAEMLIASGYADPVALLGMVSSWLNLIRLFKADLLVVDHAPTALYAARLVGLPAIPIGTGFEIPPDHTPLPSIRPWETIPDARLLHAEEFVLERLNGLVSKLGGRPISRITDLFQSPNKLLATFAELDHYGVRAGETYVGPLFWNAPGQAIIWSAPDKPHLFAYLRPNLPGFENLLKALSKLNAEVVVVAPGIPTAQVKAFAKPGFCIHTQPVQMDGLLKSADLAITTGGTGTVSQTLLAGIPLLLVPQNVEQYLMALRVEELGAGLAVRHKRQEEDFTGLLEGLLQNPSYRQTAGAFAKQYAGFKPEHIVDLAVRLIEGALNKPTGSPA
jgi:UDP:flavonoid glycosyltransferase YjiC (YdhE family)